MSEKNTCSTITYDTDDTDGTSNLDPTCTVRGRSLKNPALMAREEISAALDALSEVVNKRINASDQGMLFSTSQYFSPCEAERMHHLKMALPSQGQLRLEAIARNKERRAKRKAERQARNKAKIMA